MYIEGEVPYVAGNNYGNNGFGFGNGWEGLIGLALVAGLFGGWGNGGFGFGGNRGGNFATTEDVRSAVDQQTLISKIDQQTYGLADTFNALNNTLNSNFRGIDNAICTLGYNQAQLTNQLSSQLAGCCCDLRQQISDYSCTTNRSIDALRFENCKNTSEIIRAGQDNTRAILDYLTNEKIEGLRAENTSLKGQISNDRQSRFIIDELRNGGCPIPSYVVQPSQPVTFPTNCCGNVAYANYNGGCGCM